ncbi:MAG: carboxypeptidase regulatory-like domain-containing protein [Candidatus Kuenenia sp.]|nr:carboxypeptidase regulatory-like domain-containing protein [Candidatus Kuenenia hertensis]
MGYTDSSDFPTTSGAYDTDTSDWSDVFVTKLNSSLSASSNATIYGAVMDAEDNPIESAKVTCKGKNEKEKVLTDENGYFESTELEKGTYKITVRKKGYKKWKQKLKLGKGEEKEIEVVLEEK